MIHCHICGQETEYFLKKDSFSFQRCPSCGLVFVHPQPEEKHLHEEVYSKKVGYQKHKKKDLSNLNESGHIKKILMSLFAFSIDPFCHDEYGSQKNDGARVSS